MLAIKETFKAISKEKKITQLEMELAFIDKSVKLENGSKFAIVGSEESAD